VAGGPGIRDVPLSPFQREVFLLLAANSKPESHAGA
jgi:hypothetical protein